MNQTQTATAPNVDVTGARAPMFDDQDFGGGKHWYTVVLSDLLADWGEGATKDEAVRDLAVSLRRIHDDLHDEPDEKLHVDLRYERDFLCALLHP